MSSTSHSSIVVPLEQIDVAAYTVSTDAPESDGTLEWDSTTIVVVRARAADRVGVGYTYGHASISHLIRSKLAEIVGGRNAMDVEQAWGAMLHATRNLGRPGLVSMAVAAVDTALWDLKARLLDLPLVTLLGSVRPEIDLYGSGGFTSYSLERLRSQLGEWAEAGFRHVKMKIGRAPGEDVQRVREARRAIGDEVELFVDANGAYTPKQALAQAEEFASLGVRWFEEPVSSDDLPGLRRLTQVGPAGMEIAAGEYGYDPIYFRRMLDAEAVDVLQADITRCQGLSGLRRVSALCEAYGIPLSAHTAPALHLHPVCALHPVRHLEYFHDHVRIERMLFDGVVEPANGRLAPDLSRAGNGLELKQSDARRFAVDGE